MQRAWRDRSSSRTVRLLFLLFLAAAVLIWGNLWFSALHTASMTNIPLSNDYDATHQSSVRANAGISADANAVAEGSPGDVHSSPSEAFGVRYATLREWMEANPTRTFAQNTSCAKKLYTPTYITRLFNDMYVAVDCWHHRVVVHYRLDAPIEEWVDLIAAAGGNSPLGTPPRDSSSPDSMRSFKIPHSVATNGEIVVTESSVGGSNGQDHSVIVLRRQIRHDTQNGLQEPLFPLEFIQEVSACDNNRARRPHRIIYDAPSAAFYLYLTSPAFLSKFTWNSEKQLLKRDYCQTLPFMRGMYARSIVTQKDSLFITAGPGVVWETKIHADRVTPVRSYAVRALGFMKGKMNDLAYVDGWWYATSTVPCAIVRFRHLDSMRQHEKLHKALGMCEAFSRAKTRCTSGTPYFVSKIGNRVFVPYIFGCSGVVSFQVDNQTQAIEDVRQHWGGGWVEGADDLTCRTDNW